jgi:mannose-6-phosphate isomerase-like protein (cupin superfamily)
MDTSTTPAPIVRAEDEGDRRWFYGGGIHTWKAHPHETNGSFHLFEDRTAAGKVTPLHIHPDSDETFYVLEGEIVVHIDGVDHRVSAGGFAMAPRGVPHAFMTTSDVRMLCLHTPGADEGFYLDASKPYDELTEDERVVDFDIVRAAAAKNSDIELIGPPPFSSPASA